MKKLLKRPGFEAVFYFGILLLFVLPAMVFAQKDNKLLISPNVKQMILIDTNQRILPKYDITGDNKDALSYILKDTTGKKLQLMANSNVRVTYSRIDHMPIVHPDASQYRMPIVGGGEETLSRNLNEVTRDGAGTTSYFHVAEAPTDMCKKLAGIPVPDLAIFDLAVAPEFSTGKTQLVFTLPMATAADVTFTNSDGRTIWSEKGTGTKFNKTFMLPFKGVYYLVVKQAGKSAVKEIVKN